MKKNKNIAVRRSKPTLPVAFGLFTLILLSGAAYAPELLNPPVLPISSFETLIPAKPLVQAVRAQAAVKKHAPQSRLAQRLNGSYHIGRSLRASA